MSLSPNGPLLLHDVHLVDTLAYFNREHVPDGRPHAKGSGAFGAVGLSTRGKRVEMVESQHGFPAGDRIGRGTVATAKIVATVVDGYAVIVEVISSLEPRIAEWAEGPRIIPARAWIRGR